MRPDAPSRTVAPPVRAGRLTANQRGGSQRFIGEVDQKFGDAGSIARAGFFRFSGVSTSRACSYLSCPALCAPRGQAGELRVLLSSSSVALEAVPVPSDGSLRP